MTYKPTNGQDPYGRAIFVCPFGEHAKLHKYTTDYLGPDLDYYRCAEGHRWQLRKSTKEWFYIGMHEPAEVY